MCPIIIVMSVSWSVMDQSFSQQVDDPSSVSGAEVLHVCDDDLESVIVPASTLDEVREFIESLLNSEVKGVKDSDHNNNNSVDDISLVSLGQDPRSEVDTTKYESKPVVEDVEEANNNNSDDPYDDVELKSRKRMKNPQQSQS